jgi:hypothetical protein
MSITRTLAPLRATRCAEFEHRVDLPVPPLLLVNANTLVIYRVIYQPLELMGKDLQKG